MRGLVDLNKNTIEIYQHGELVQHIVLEDGIMVKPQLPLRINTEPTEAIYKSPLTLDDIEPPVDLKYRPVGEDK